MPGLLKIRSHEIPIDQIPERLDILWTGVAVVDVVGVFPHIAGQQRLVFAGERGGGVADPSSRRNNLSIFCWSGKASSSLVGAEISF